LSVWLGEKAIWMGCMLLLVSWKTADIEKKGQKTELQLSS